MAYPSLAARAGIPTPYISVKRLQIMIEEERDALVGLIQNGSPDDSSSIDEVVYEWAR